MTPIAPTVNEVAPPFRNSLGVISSPAINKITIADISPICRTVSSKTTSGFPSKNGRLPNAKGPTIIPAKSSPNTTGALTYEKVQQIF